MSAQVCEQLMLFPADSPASPFLSPGSAEARRMTVTSGRRCLELSARSGRVGLLAKMLLGSSIWRSTRCFLTWKVSATPAKHLLFRLVPSTPRTDATALRLWPTPSAREFKGGRRPETLKAKGRTPSNTLADSVKSAGEVGQLNPDWVEWLMGFPIGWTDLDA